MANELRQLLFVFGARQGKIHWPDEALCEADEFVVSQNADMAEIWLVDHGFLRLKVRSWGNQGMTFTNPSKTSGTFGRLDRPF
ncbi:MAG: hypothetical protein ACOYXR_07100 [Nitrospirota bacterium]